MSLLLNVVDAECRKSALYAECRYAECHYDECQYADCYYDECHCAECHGAYLNKEECGIGDKSNSVKH